MQEFTVVETVRYRVLAETPEHAKQYVENFTYKRGRRRFGIVSENSEEVLVMGEFASEPVRIK